MDMQRQHFVGVYDNDFRTDIFELSSNQLQPFIPSIDFIFFRFTYVHIVQSLFLMDSRLFLEASRCVGVKKGDITGQLYTFQRCGSE